MKITRVDQFSPRPRTRLVRISTDTGIEGDGERFEAEVWVEGERLGRGIGRSKRLAERAAAEVALDPKPAAAAS